MNLFHIKGNFLPVHYALFRVQKSIDRDYTVGAF